MVFNKNGSITPFPNEYTLSYLMNATQFTWKFVGYHSKKDSFGVSIRVNYFPKELITRNKDNWGWIIQCPYQVKTSYEIPNPKSDIYKNTILNDFNNFDFSRINNPDKYYNPFYDSKYIKISKQDKLRFERQRIDSNQRDWLTTLISRTNDT